MDDEDPFDLDKITNERKEEVLSATYYDYNQLNFIDSLHKTANNLYIDFSNDVINSSDQNQELMFLAHQISSADKDLIKSIISPEILIYLYNAFMASSPNDARLPFISYIIYYALLNVDEIDIFMTPEFIEKIFTLNKNVSQDVRDNIEHIFAFLNYRYNFSQNCPPEIAFEYIKAITNPIVQACCYSNLNQRNNKFQPDELLSLIDFGFAILSNSNDDKTSDTILAGLAINLSELDNISPYRGAEAIVLLNQSDSIGKILYLLQTKTASFNAAAVIYFLMKFGFKSPEFIDDLLNIIQNSLEHPDNVEILESILKLYSKIIKFNDIPVKTEHFDMFEDVYYESPLKLKNQILNLLQSFIERDGKQFSLCFSNEFIKEILDTAINCPDNSAKYPLDLLSALFLINHPSIRDLRDTEELYSLQDRIHEIKQSYYYGELNKSADKCLIALDTFIDSIRSYNSDLSD
ncbi:hypothetical protein TVAG_054180 [Trichomonas vaginalis G3]|uniref:Uncharacterized protein n=1 Tax=Trichomonas vaginalis (strain ATCC PRA-98 / G3) TaxID=412133 RepID=A2FMQ6_TRIV3|nr:armadillo (ARM) repeat-containing protein family [Trichomonas vaginalis G3]EAX93813.1 hypothetical protein TVAG_054180 [Trichomonas vaginalis G3]KAI5486348.1 armadillo (ARM) repeat-containing protein family [Trichomonas vaginalis G3]|eukprot:XP_001306743.1 hypothetical protein [Trichomonas vaginalis G3]